MAPRKSHSVTLFYLALLFAFALVADASSPQQLNHKRLLRKRAPQGLAQPNLIPGPGVTPSSRTSLSVSSAANTASSATPTTTSVIVNPLSASSASLTSSSNSLPTSSSSSSSSSSSTSASSSNTDASSTSASASPSSALSSSAKSTPTSLDSGAPSTFTQTATLTRASATPSAQAQGAASPSGATSAKKTTTMVIIIIAASVGGIAILWTLFRKWKLRRSSRFDERLQPIDWQPPTSGDGRHRPSSIDSAFRSGAAHGAHGSESGHATSDHEHKSIPDHDFTPLPSNRLAPVGAYTDLTRGPSPLPEMQEAYGRHSPVMTRPAYDIHVPLHHQAGYGAHGHDVYNHTQFNSGPLGY